MFGWIRKLFGSKPKREVFRFWDGNAWRLADPLQSFLFLKDHHTFKIESDPQLADQGHVDATRRLINATREVFQVRQLAQGGLTDGEVLALMGQFVAYMEDVKKKSNPSLM